MKARCIIVWRDDRGKTPKTLKANLEQHAEVMIRGTEFVQLFSWWLTVNQRGVQAEDFCLVSFSRAPSRLPYVHSFVPQHFLGLGCRSSWRNRTLKQELQMGSQGEEGESRPFLNNSSGKVHYCANPCLESRKLFQFFVFLFSFLLPVIAAQMASSSGQGHSPKRLPNGSSGMLRTSHTIAI